MDQALYFVGGIAVALMLMILKHLLSRKNNTNTDTATQKICTVIHADHERFAGLLTGQSEVMKLTAHSVETSVRTNEQIVRHLTKQTSCLELIEKTMVTKEYFQEHRKQSG